MAREKLFTAKQAAEAVIQKTQELLQASQLAKSSSVSKPAPEMEKCGGMTKADVTPPDGVKTQPDPKVTSSETKNGNPAPGAFPQNQEKYGAELKGHLKLAKFVGRMEQKRKAAPAAPTPEAAPKAPVAKE